MKNSVSVDVQTIFHKKEERTCAAMKFYCGQKKTPIRQKLIPWRLIDFKSALERYPDLQNDMKSYQNFRPERKSPILQE
jgi:DNA polymerase-3 subunit epsilon